MSDPRQWQVVRATLDPVRGPEQGGVRPVLVVSTDRANRFLTNVTVLPLTTHKAGVRVYWNEVLLPAECAGQPNASIVMAHQVRTLSKERISHTYGELIDEDLREQVRGAMRLYLDLEEDSMP